VTLPHDEDTPTSPGITPHLAVSHAPLIEATRSPDGRPSPDMRRWETERLSGRFEWLLAAALLSMSLLAAVLWWQA
jgi:hypothetical protein